MIWLSLIASQLTDHSGSLKELLAGDISNTCWRQAGDQRGYGLGWDSEPIYITTRQDGGGKKKKREGPMSATAVLNQGHKARSETWRDAEGVKDGEEKLKRVRRGRQKGWRSVRGQAWQTQRKGSERVSARRWRDTEFARVSRKLFWQVTLMWNIKTTQLLFLVPCPLGIFFCFFKLNVAMLTMFCPIVVLKRFRGSILECTFVAAWRTFLGDFGTLAIGEFSQHVD